MLVRSGQYLVNRQYAENSKCIEYVQTGNLHHVAGMNGTT